MLKRPEFIFIIFGLIFGLFMIFITPKFGVPDENGHFARAQEVSKGILYNNLPQNRKDNYQFHGASGYSPIMYAFSGLSLKITQKFDENIQFYTGRIVNLIVWILLIALAIHITPVFKWAYFIAALLPMSIFEGMSYSADSFSNAFAFLFFAYIFKLIFNDKEFSYKKDIPILAFFAITGALCKGIVFPLFLLPFVNIKKHKWPIILSLILLSFGTSYLWSSNNFVAIGPNCTYEINKSKVSEHPIAHLQLIFETLINCAVSWYIQLIGKLGWLCIPLDRQLYNLTTLTFLTAFVFIPEKYSIKISQRLIALSILIIFFITLSTLMFCICNRAQDVLIMGIQGRYFIPLLPAIFLILTPNKKLFGGKYENLIKTYIIIFCFILLYITCDRLHDIAKLGEQFFFGA